MRRITILLSALLFALAMTAAPAVAMQPPEQGDAAHHLFGCPDPVTGHPGAVDGDGGIDDATGLVADLKPDVPEDAADQASARPTAWAAVDNAEPIELGEC